MRRDGTWPPIKSLRFVILRRVSSSLLSAVIERGTDCKDSERFCAVTTISSRPTAAGVGDEAVCAQPPLQPNKATAAIATPARRLLPP